MTFRSFSFQNKNDNIYDSDSDLDDDFNEPIGKKINSKGNYMRIKTKNEDYQKNQQFGDQKSNTETLKKNRQSAKQCRERKKIYIELLEKKVDQLRQQIQTSKTNLKSQLKSLTKLTSQIDPSKINYLFSKMLVQKQMSSTDLSDNPKQLQNLIDLYLYKFDVNGKLRKELVNSQFESLIKQILDHKILNFWDGFFADSNLLQRNCFDIFGLEIGSIAPNLISSNIHNNRSTMLHLLMQIRDIKHNLQSQGQRIQYLVQRLSKHLTPGGIQKFLLHPIYLSETNRLQLGISLTDSFTSVSTKKAKKE